MKKLLGCSLPNSDMLPKLVADFHSAYSAKPGPLSKSFLSLTCNLPVFFIFLRITLFFYVQK